MSDRPVALVTGASRGIGRAIAVALGRAGYSVAVNYLRSEEAAREVVAEIEAGGGAATAIAADVGDVGSGRRLVEQTLDAFSRIDLLVNNAGITSQGRRDLLEATEESWDLVLNTNLKGPFFLSQCVAKQMAQRRAGHDADAGFIVNVSSVSAYAVSTNRADYCIAKAGMRMMTQLLADRLAEAGIRVYEVCPGVIASDMTAPVQKKYDRLIAEGLTPIRRWGQPEDVARAVVALASEAFPFSTGDCLNVDGGFHIRRL